ncbi:MAG: 1,4-alpha-glucan branching protein domain-containing protein [Dethiobacter sp.]
MAKGHLNLVLHAHLPFVYSAGEEHHLEERWFFEAMTESYLPLLIMLERLKNQNVPYALTFSFSPTLLAMLDHPVLIRRYEDYLQRLIRLAESEVNRTRGQELFHRLASYYRDRLSTLHQTYIEYYHGNILAGFSSLAKNGNLELITTCATHGYLPLMQTNEAVSTQIQVGLDAFSARIGYRPRGIWLPECGYFPGLDKILAENQLEFTFVDTHGLKNAWPPPQNNVYAPVRTSSGVAIFARDPETSSQVWSIQSGYPGNPDYREYYRDIGFDLDEAYLHRFLPYLVRINTGLKYWRVTGNNLPKEPYDPWRALERAQEHAANFHFNRERQIEHLAARQAVVPVVTAPYDAELFGHWWFEGPDFLESLLRKAAECSDIYKLSTPSRYLDAYGCSSTAELFHSSWGEGGYSKVWLNPKNDWLYPRYHQAEKCLIRHAAAHPKPDPEKKLILNQMTRELLLAQSSDWAFMLNAGTTHQYATQRVLAHLENFSRLDTMISSGQNCVTELTVAEITGSDLFPVLEPQSFVPEQFSILSNREADPTVLMLSWEYPPEIMGGLARHMEDLSETLSKQGQPVAVLTSRTGNTAPYELNNGVYVYRLAPYQRAGEDIDFYNWVMQLNLLFFNLAQQLISANKLVVLHAHDWLVGAAALKLKHFWQLPLVVTIHSTEFGRNGGLYTELQKKIHAEEQKLAEGADQLICCSYFMAQEVSRLFSVPMSKISVIQNGVMPEKVMAKRLQGEERRKYAKDKEAIIYFIGRLVREKGVESLVRALISVLPLFPNTKAVISGKGPMLNFLKILAEEHGVADSIIFTGFVTDEERNRLLATADIAVLPSLYEPFGIVALEAMAAAAPLIVSDVGGLGEVVRHGSDGLKFPPGNHLALSAAISTLLADPLLRERLGRQAKERAVTAYSWQELAKQTKQIYKQVWEEAQSARKAE